jgi:ATP dependent DNA ligase domain
VPLKRQSPTFIKPMTAIVVQALPEGEQWSYEVKFDGYRALIIKDGDRVQIRSRNNNDLTRTYPAVATAASRLRAESAAIDGEIVAVDSDGRPSFQALQHSASQAGHSIIFYAFDLVHLDGEDLTQETAHGASEAPQEGRRALGSPEGWREPRPDHRRKMKVLPLVDSDEKSVNPVVPRSAGRTLDCRRVCRGHTP